MEHQEYSVGLDIGTTKIVAIVGRRNKHGMIEVLGMGRAKSLGVYGGVINNIAQTVESIKSAISAAEKSANISIKKVTVGIAGKHIRAMQHSDYIVRDNHEDMITEDDIEKLRDKVNKIVMLPGEQIISILPQEYKVDSQMKIYNPIGMHGKMLEANFHVVIGRVASIKNIIRCVKEAGLEMEHLTLEPIASAEAILSSEEKEAGVAIVDIGGGTTDVAIFKDNIIRHTCVIPYGGGIITEDIKEGCSIIERHAEQLKVRYGSALPDQQMANTFITIPGLNGRKDKEISVKTLAQIINARVDEILEMVNSELKLYGAHEAKKKLIGGIVITGGGSNLKHLRQLCSYITGLESRVGFANEFIANDKSQILKNPEYATAVGLLMESLEIRDRKKTEEPAEEEISIEKAEESVISTMEENPKIEISEEKRLVIEEQPTTELSKEDSFIAKLKRNLSDRMNKFLNDME